MTMKILFVASLLLPYVVTGQSTKCAFLVGAEPVEFSLPGELLSHPRLELPIEFRGLSPIVTRKQLKYGEMPKVTIERYSSKPDIYFDEESGRVVVTAASCMAEEGSTDSSGIRIQPIVGLLASLLHPSLRPYGAVFALAAAAVSVNAQEETCMPVVQVVVQAPSAYQGAVETCYEEIDDPAICPDPFPTYPTCDDPAPTCQVAVVGAGAGGLYTAMRMVDEGKVNAEDVCVFEMTERAGGRLFSLRGLGPEGDLSVDAGGYRTWPEFTPTLHALITEYLQIPMDCYDDSVPCQVFNIVDSEGKKDGFATFVERMLDILVTGGACWYPYHELTRVTKVTSDTTELDFANGVTATVSGGPAATILNLPQRPLLNVVRNSNFDEAGILDEPTLDALHSVQTVVATKFYLYYPKGSVFWRKLGIVSGDFEADGDARSMLLAGRYHDGHVECDDENDPDTCHGFLLAVYANDLSGNKAQFFRRYQRVRPEPVTFIAPSDLEGKALLEHAHSRLIDFHLYENTDAPYSGFEAQRVFSSVEPPEFGILSTWNIAIPWSGGAWHSWTDLSKIELAKQPFVEDNIFVVNEAYSLLQGWAEGSLKIADEILEDYFDVPRPWNFTAVDLNQIVRQTNSRECVEVVDSGTSASDGGDSDGGDGGGSGGGGGALLCFTEDAQVEMADGTLRSIKDVKEGDYVATGTGIGRGLVTEALVHPVNKEVEVASVETEYGELVGTPDHPVLEAGEWVEIADIPSSSAEVSMEQRYVDVFYNLEVDGDILDDSSSHSYVVNGVVASGLGDNKILNAKFPRQKVWKDFTAEK